MVDLAAIGPCLFAYEYGSLEGGETGATRLPPDWPLSGGPKGAFGIVALVLR